MSISINSTTKRAAAQLAIIAYTDEANATQQRADMAAALAALPADSNGPFTLLFGPASSNGVLLYAARGADGTLAVAFRGTISSGGAIDVVSNLVDDMLGISLVPWQYPLAAGAKVTWGMNTALAMAAAATDPLRGTTILDFLRDELAAGGTVPVMVVGHSLGAALASVAAVWLADQLPRAGGPKAAPAVVPFTFAAPTVTDSVFAKLFATACPVAYHCVNTDDVVPKAWMDLAGIASSFSGPGQSLWNYSILLYTAVKTASLAAKGIDFAPLPGTMDEFSGVRPASGSSFAMEAEAQHSVTGTYLPHVTGP
jgi:Lipase (class 3)